MCADQPNAIIADLWKCDLCETSKDLQGFEFYSTNFGQQFMILLQNPGYGPKDKQVESDKPKQTGSIQDCLTIWRNQFKTWCLEPKMSQFRELLDLMRKKR